MDNKLQVVSDQTNNNSKLQLTLHLTKPDTDVTHRHKLHDSSNWQVVKLQPQLY
jgi:hypothetical protein